MNQEDFARMLEGYLPDADQARARQGEDRVAAHPSRQPGVRSWPVQARCDLHGQTADQARKSVDRFLKDCVSRGVRKVVIIHGKGSGTLKAEVARYLEGHPLAGRREEAPLNEGGGGALVVYLRRT